MKQISLAGILTFLCPSTARLQGSGDQPASVTPPFNLNAVVGEVTHRPIEEGGRIIISDRLYRAVFDSIGVTVEARCKTEGAGDVFVPIRGAPYIQNGRVVYDTPGCEIAFKGGSAGVEFELRTDSGKQSQHRIEFSGNAANLVWHENSVNTCNAGEFLIDTHFVRVPTEYNQWSPAAAFDGTNYFVVWEDFRRDNSADIFGARIAANGVLIDSIGIPISRAARNQAVPAIVFTDSFFMVVWQDNRDTTNNDIYGARVSKQGCLIDTGGFPIAVAFSEQELPSIAVGDSTFMVVWQDRRSGSNYDIYGARVTKSGQVLEPNGIPISRRGFEQRTPAICFGDTTYLVLWEDDRNGLWDLYGARVGQNGTVIDTSGLAVCRAGNAQYTPVVVFDGTNYFAVWQDERGGNADIYGARMARSGVVLDTLGIPIAANSRVQRFPALGFDGTNYLAVWSDELSSTNYDIYGARISRGGVVLDPGGLPIVIFQNRQALSALVFGGGNYLVAWADLRNGPHYLYDVYAARVAPTGVVLDSASLISAHPYAQDYPYAAFDGTNFLMTWDDWRTGGPSDIYGTRVSPTGSILDPSGIPISTASGHQSYSSIAFDGTNYLVVWFDQRADTLNLDIYGARVTTSGQVLDPQGIAISTATGSQICPAVAFDGVNYLVVWQDKRNGPYDIYGARVSPAGVVLDPSGIVISTLGDYQEVPAVAYGNTCYLVAWTYSETNIHGRRVTPSGTVLDTADIPICVAGNVQYNPSIASDRTKFLVVWHDSRSGDRDIYGARVSEAGQVLDPTGIPICVVPGSQWCASVTSDGTQFMAVWYDGRSFQTYDIYGAVLNGQGSVLYPVLVSDQPGHQLDPCVTYGRDGTFFTGYSSWTDSITGRFATTKRIWGKYFSLLDAQEQAGTERLSGPVSRLSIRPNPFLERTIMKADFLGDSRAELKIFDAAGRIVNELPFAPGGMSWDGTDKCGQQTTPGVYFCCLKSNGSTVIEKMVKLGRR